MLQGGFTAALLCCPKVINAVYYTLEFICIKRKRSYEVDGDYHIYY